MGAQEYFLPQGAGLKVLLNGGAEYFLPQGAGYPSYTTDLLSSK